MGKTEEYLAKKRNKAARKRLNNTVDFTRGVQAAKHRRKAGRRRACEGMCYSLPTPEDPFNDLYKEKLAKKKAKKVQEDGNFDDRNGKKDLQKDVNQKNVKKSKANDNVERNSLPKRSEAKVPDDPVIELEFSNHALRNGENDALLSRTSYVAKVKWKPKCEHCLKSNNTWTCAGGNAFEVALCALLNANIINYEQHENNAAVVQKMPFETKCIGSERDWLFWEACGTGSDVLATGRAGDTLTQASSVLAAVAHIASRRALQLSSKGPLVLFLVRSKEQTLQVRSIVKFLKFPLGLHAVSLHTQTPLQHQIEGMKSTATDVLVATPERLRELLLVNAVSLSNISFMVVDGVQEFVSCGLSDDLLRIKASVSDNAQTVLSSAAFPHSTNIICQKLLKGPICRVMSNTLISECCACISQNVQVFVSEEKRQQKLKRILSDHLEGREGGDTSVGLIVLFRQFQSLSYVKEVLQEEGYSIEVLSDDTMEGNGSSSLALEQLRSGQVEILLCTHDYASRIELSAIGTIILYEFPASIDFYRLTLMRMARYTVNGVLYSFCSGATAPLASQLIDVLQECLQPIPTSLRMLAEAAQVVEQRKA